MMTLAEEWEAALENFEAATENLAAKRPDLWQMDRRLTDMESEIVANGGLAERMIDGKNEAQRTAQLRSILNELPAYRATQEARDTLKAWLLGVEMHREVAAEQMRRCRALIALEESENLVTAYAARPLLNVPVAAVPVFAGTHHF